MCSIASFRSVMQSIYIIHKFKQKGAQNDVGVLKTSTDTHASTCATRKQMKMQKMICLQITSIAYQVPPILLFVSILFLVFPYIVRLLIRFFEPSAKGFFLNKERDLKTISVELDSSTCEVKRLYRTVNVSSSLFAVLITQSSLIVHRVFVSHSRINVLEEIVSQDPYVTQASSCFYLRRVAWQSKKIAHNAFLNLLTLQNNWMIEFFLSPFQQIQIMPQSISTYK